MMNQKAFAKFPTTGGGYQYIDIFTIEAIGQGGTTELATMFAVGSDRYYLVEIPTAELERAGEPDAASWCLSLISKVARMGMPIADPGERDQDFDPPKGPAKIHGNLV